MARTSNQFDIGQRALTLGQLLRYRAEHQPDQCAYTFLFDADGREASLSYTDLLRQARAVSASLRQFGPRQKRVLLCIPPGPEYLSAFFGCLYAGDVAVPAYPPDAARLNRTVPPLRAICADAQPTLCLVSLSDRELVEQVFRQNADLRSIRFLSVEEVLANDGEGWENPAVAGDTLGFLMYTSGSTGHPKGVMVKHENVMHNLGAFAGFKSRPCTTFVSWVPVFHDLGLLFGVLHPLFRGARSILLPPTSFVKRPIRWLQAISRSKATTSAAPNWAFDYCVRKIPPEERAGLELQTWTLALNGGESVRHDTLERFTAAFTPFGFRREAFYPSYGLAEGIGTVSGPFRASTYHIYNLSNTKIQRSRAAHFSFAGPEAKPFVGCGRTLPGQKILIVDPDQLTICRPGQLGEIWVSGPSVCQGYWNRPEDSRRTFCAYLTSAHQGPFLRTGDLGFLHAEELFITGRLKDVIVVRGTKFDPQDIEASVQRSDLGLRSGCSAAFSVEVRGEERLVIVCEVQSPLPEIGEAMARIRQAVAEEHGLEVYSIALIRPGSILKTTSGKIRRGACRAQFLARDLEIVAEWRGSPMPEDDVPGSFESVDTSAWPLVTVNSNRASDPTLAVEAYLVSHFSKRFGLDARVIDVSQPFTRYGLSSVEAVTLARELEKGIGRTLPPTVLWEHPTIRSLARHITQPQRSQDNGTDASAASHSQPGRIAIVGMSCRFPGASSKEAFWRLLCDGVDGITETPTNRWDTAALPENTIYRRGGFLEGLEYFDAAFFGISPREAPHVDPRQRLILELTWEALQDAGIPPDSLAGTKTGVFMAVLSNDYDQILFHDLRRVEAYSGPGTANSVVANRVSYVLDLRGPSLVVDTACSGSLVAIHLACQSLRSGECALAIAGGVSLNLLPNGNVFFSQASVLSPEGCCKAFDAHASGIVRSEGAGVLILKPLAQALVDLDPVYGVIPGSAVNSDGRTNGLMAPSLDAQEAVIREAYDRAGIPPVKVQYIEAHGTGTSVGDPIETQALGRVLGTSRPPGKTCALGSVKSNIGHTEAAAGVASVMKVALAVKHRIIPPSIHFQVPNPLISFQKLPLAVQKELGPWPNPEDTPLIAGVSGFGFGGTNAHVVIEEAPPTTSSDRKMASRESHLFPLSAESPEALDGLVRTYRDCLAGPFHEAALADICYTASVRRSHHRCRLAIVAQSHQELKEHLESFLRREARPRVCYGAKPPISRPGLVFVFSGQGSHWRQMGHELLEQEPVFRATLEHCDRLLRERTDWSLIEELISDPGSDRVQPTDVIQLSVFGVQVALANLWRSLGIEPDVVVGQSLGEVAMAHVSGALELRDALAIVFHRSRLMKKIAGQGRTALVGLPIERAKVAIAGREDSIGIGGTLSPGATLISGHLASLEQLVSALQRDGILCRILPGVDVGLHSPQMEPLKAELENALQKEGLQPKTASVPVFSTVTGTRIDGSQMNAKYWARNLREPFLFADVMKQLLQESCDTFLEISPHPVLSASILDSATRYYAESIRVLPSLRRGEAWCTLLQSLGSLYAQGRSVEWKKLFPEGGRCIPSPTYPWQRQRYWFDQLDRAKAEGGPASEICRSETGVVHPFLGAQIVRDGPEGQHVWQTEISLTRPGYLGHHRLQGVTLVPAAVYVEMALAAARHVFGSCVLAVEDVHFKRALVLRKNQTRQAQIILRRRVSAEATFQVLSRALGKQEGSWTEHAIGVIRYEAAHHTASEPKTIALESIRSRCSHQVPGPAHYQKLRNLGLEYGPSFQVVTQLWVGDGECIGALHLPDDLVFNANTYGIHPVLLDAGFQIVAALAPNAEDGHGAAVAYIPVAIAGFRLFDCIGRKSWCAAKFREPAAPGARFLGADLSFFDETGRVLAQVKDLKLQSVGSVDQPTPRTKYSWLYETQWRPRPRLQSGISQGSRSTEGRGKWLIFADTKEVGTRLAALLERRGNPCVLISPGKAYRVEEGGRRYSVNPARDEDIKRAVRETLGADGRSCSAIVHLWSLDFPPPDKVTVASLRAAQILGCGAIASIVQTLAQNGRKANPRVWLITAGAQQVNGDMNSPAIVQAPLWGLGRTISQEHPEFWGGLLDLPSRVEPKDVEALLEQISLPDGENQVAIRDNQRFVARFGQYACPTRSFVKIRPDASYVLTGGLGGLGLAVAQWMAGEGARQIFLLSRTKLPSRSTWNQVPDRDPHAQAIASVRHIEAQGASVHVSRVDIADEASMSRFIRQFRNQEWPPIRGVAHLAGVVEDQLLLRMKRRALNAVLRPKILGSWLLHHFLDEVPLDFFIMFSSVASVLGSVGQASYAAGNAFMDALAYFRRANGRPATSISWGPWSEIGMAAQRHLTVQHVQRGLKPITPDEGIETLAWVLRSDPVHVTAARIDWQQLLKSYSPSAQPLLFSELLSPEDNKKAPEETQVDTVEVLQQLLRIPDPARRQAALDSQVHALAASVLHMDGTGLDLDEALHNLGLDSIMAVELKNRIQARFGVSPPVIDFFGDSSVRSLGRRIASQLLNEEKIGMALQELDQFSVAH